MTSEEYAIDGYYLSRFEERDIANNDFLCVVNYVRFARKRVMCLAHFDIDDRLVAVSNHFESTIFLLVIEHPELPLLLPIIQRANRDHYQDGNQDRYPFNPVDSWLCAFNKTGRCASNQSLTRAEIRVETQGHRDNRRNAEQDL